MKRAAKRAPRARRTRGVTLPIVVAGLLAGTGAVGFAAYRQTPPGVIPPGVSVAGTDWSGKTVDNARRLLETWRKEQRARPLKLMTDARASHHWSPTRGALGADVDVAATVAEAQRVGASDSAFERLLSWFAGRRSVEIAPKWTMDQKAIQRYLKRKVAPVVARPVRNARFLPEGGGFQVIRERRGAALDVPDAARLVAERIPSASNAPVVLPMRALKPLVTAADFGGVHEEISHFQTYYSETGNRRRNIEVACSKINGTLLKPGEVFSYNQIVGPRDEDAGFRMAPVIVRGKLVPGLGGGVCQVSSTLYNAALLAGLRIVSRTHHEFPVHYLPSGRDATVAYDSIDFRFQNDTHSPILIAADGTGGRVRMRVFGSRVPGEVVSLQRTDVHSWDAPISIVHDSSLPAGKRVTVMKAHRGRRVKLWRMVKRNGVVVKRELISSDYYHPITGVVEVGARPTAPRPASSAPVQSPASITPQRGTPAAPR